MRRLKVLVACEFSGRVREAFRRVGCDAYSCDLVNTSTDDKSHHIIGDVRSILKGYDGKKWDLMIAHPPCTHLAVSGATHFWKKHIEQEEALQFVLDLMNAPIPRICVENPVSVISTRIKKPSQIIHPWWFGDLECKATCLWLKYLPDLYPTDEVPYHMRKSKAVRDESPSKDRPMIRSVTFWGIAKAMAQQWGAIEPKDWLLDLPPCNYSIKPKD